MSDDIQQETKRIHRNIVESLSFSEALANRDAEIARLRKELEGADRIANNFAQTACLRGDEIERLRELRDTMLKGEVAIRQRDANEIERLRGLLRECLPHFERGQPILWKRIREALGDE